MPTTSGATTFEATAVPIGSTVVLVVSKGAPPATSANAPIPVVVGMAQAKALAAFEQANVNAQFFTQASESHPVGTVVAQWPKPGDVVGQGESGALLVSAGYPAEGTSLVGVPTVVGQHEAQAQSALQKAGLTSTVVRVSSATVPEGVVLGQLPEERTAVATPPDRTWIWVVAVLAVLAVLLGAAWLFTRPSGGAQVAVPGVVGQTQDAAQEALAAAGLTAGPITQKVDDAATASTVVSQDPPQGAQIAKGSQVALVIAAKSGLVTVPDVVSQSKDSALQLLARAQLTVTVNTAADKNVPSGDVISQSPAAAAQVAPNSDVTIVVSTGPGLSNVDVPNVVGLSESDAINTLSDAGLQSRSFDSNSSTVPTGDVAGQAPEAGSSVPTGTTIAIRISIGPEQSQGQNVNVPNVVGSTLADATSQLTGLGLTVTSFTTDGSGKPANQVVFQTPAAGDSAPKNSQVVLIVSSGS